jgi:prevent-host-death family protein
VKKNKIGRRWQLQEAKNRLSQVVEEARHQGPQTITLRGKPAAVVLSFEEYTRLIQPQSPLVEFLLQSPLCGLDLPIERSRDAGREVEL